MAFSLIPELSYEVNGPLVMLEQGSGIGENCRVELHALHVRHLASELGLLDGDTDAWRLVRTLERRILTLRDRIEELHDRLLAVPVFPPDPDRPLDPDEIFSEATLQLADEWCSEIADWMLGKQVPDLVNGLSKVEAQPSAGPLFEQGGQR